MSRSLEYVFVVDPDGAVQSIKPGYREEEAVTKTLKVAFPDALHVEVKSPEPGYSCLTRNWLFVIPCETFDAYDAVQRYVRWIDGELSNAVWSIDHVVHSCDMPETVAVSSDLEKADKIGRKTVRARGGKYALGIMRYV